MQNDSCKEAIEASIKMLKEDADRSREIVRSFTESLLVNIDKTAIAVEYITGSREIHAVIAEFRRSASDLALLLNGAYEKFESYRLSMQEPYKVKMSEELTRRFEAAERDRCEAEAMRMGFEQDPIKKCSKGVGNVDSQ